MRKLTNGRLKLTKLPLNLLQPSWAIESPTRFTSIMTTRLTTSEPLTRTLGNPSPIRVELGNL
jgi:hypothetical protein